MTVFDAKNIRGLCYGSVTVLQTALHPIMVSAYYYAGRVGPCVGRVGRVGPCVGRVGRLTFCATALHPVLVSTYDFAGRFVAVTS